MARYSNNFTDARTGTGIKGAQVFVYRYVSDVAEPETLATITADGGAAIVQPLVTGDDGGFAFNAPDERYIIDYWFGGKRLFRDRRVIVGEPVITEYPEGAIDAGFAARPTTTALASATGAGLGFQQTGTGAAQRDVRAKAGERKTPEDRNAVGNLVANDGAAFGLALDNGATALVGSYLLSTWTHKAVTSPVIAGEGQTVRGPVSPTKMLRPSGTFDLSGVTFDRWQVVAERLAADGGSITRGTVEAISFTGGTGPSVYLTCPTSNVTVSGSLFSNTTGGYSVIVGENDRSLEVGWTGARVMFNTFLNLKGQNSSAAATLLYGSDHVILGNRIDGVSQVSGSAETWGVYGKLRHGVVAFNSVRNVDWSGSGDITGITIKGAPRGYSGPSVSPSGFGSLGIGNVVRDIGAHAVRGTGIRAQTSEVALALNFVENPGLTGVTMDEETGIRNLSIANRVLFTTANTAGTVGYRLEQGGGLTRSIGDQSIGAQVGFRVDASAVGDRFLIADAHVSGGTTGVSVNTTPAIAEMTVRGLRQDSGTTGFRIDGGTIDRMRFVDNDLADGIAPFAGTLPVDAVIRHTQRFQTTNATPLNVCAMSMPDNATYFVQVRIVGTAAGGGKRATYHRQATVYRDGAGATIQGGVQDIGAAVETTAGWDATVAVSGNDVFAALTGEAGETINWRVAVEVIGIGG